MKFVHAYTCISVILSLLQVHQLPTSLNKDQEEMKMTLTLKQVFG